ncbi:hypothetical protein [Parabacteroides sp. An277]|uniref:hypothetical protein n=1 Tax=Parabacteroides sp. An277 TaxID=1965619 RepID=UPI0011249A63|nr:hypothetical protein [Parabacteroides sp. An277]
MECGLINRIKKSVWNFVFVSYVVSLCLCMSSCEEDEPTGQSINLSFKDQELLSYLLDHYDLNGDGALSTEEAARVKELEIDYSITHLEGLEYLTSLEKLDITNGHIQHLDLSSFPLLKTLSIQGDSLQTISLPSNNSLETMTCYACPFLETGEDFYRQFGNLERLYCDTTFLSIVGLEVFPKLRVLDYNGEIYFDISGNQQLDTLTLTSSWDGTKKSITIKNVSARAITLNRWALNLYIENCPSLDSLRVGGDSNSLTIKDCPSMQNLYFQAKVDSALTIENCEQLEQLYSYVGDMKLDLKQVPNLKKISLQSYIYEPAFVEASTQNISFAEVPSLEELRIKGNVLYSLDVTENKQLKKLDIESTAIHFLNVSHLENLERQTCKSHRLSMIDASYCTRLDTCIFTETRDVTLESLNVSGCASLKCLELGRHMIETLDLRDTDIRKLNVRYKAESLNPWGTIKYLYLNSNIEELDCYNNRIESLDLSHTNIQILDATNNSLKELKIGSNIKVLKCRRNYIPELDLSNCHLLDTLDCSMNSIKELSLVDMPFLKYIEITNNSLDKVILQGCPNLTVLSVGNSGTSKNYCSLVQLLDCNGLENVDISALNYQISNSPNLKSLSLNRVNQDGISIKDYQKLQYLSILNSSIGEISVSDLPLLDELRISQNEKLKSIQMENIPQLKTVTIDNNKSLQVVNLVDFPLLNVVKIAENRSMENVSLSSQALTTIEMTDNVNISNLTIEATHLTSLKLSNLTNLPVIDLSSFSELVSFSCTGCDLFTSLDFTQNSLQLKVDCRGNQSLQTIYANPNQNIIKDDFTNIEYIY